MHTLSSSRPDPLGVTPDGHGGANVALWASGATGVELCTFDDAGHETRIPLTENVFGVFHQHVENLPAGTRYGFRVDGPWEPQNGLRWNRHKLLLDPYAKAIDGEVTFHSALFAHIGTDDLMMSTVDSAPFVPRSVVVDYAFDWRGVTPPRTPWRDTVIYEAHVKGLTMLNPGVPQEMRGTYAGVGHPITIAYLRSLGITAIELLPVHHFVDESHLAELGLTNYWGYNSIGFFAPHANYASTGTRGEQVQEFRNMVKALHEAGIEVILDVVYNHTAEGNQMGPTLCFRGIDNADYYRLAEDKRFYTDFTGCGNTLNATNPHVVQMIMDSLRYWVTEMHIDGFRFDLASALARSDHDVDMLGTFMTTIAQDPVLRNVKLIAEPWDVGPGGYQVGEFPPLWTEWNDKYRDCLRDFWRGATGIGELGWRLTGSADLYASDGRRPYASINFITAHDGFPIRDLTTYEHKHNEANGEQNRDGTDNNRSANYGIEGETDDHTINAIRHRQIRNMMTSLLLSTGVPMLTAGDEIGRTQDGNNNAYCQDNEISWLDWNLAPWQGDLLDFTRTLLRIRADHPVFRQRYFFDGRPLHEGGPKDLAWIAANGAEVSEDDWHSPDSCTLGMFIAGDVNTHGEEIVHDDSFLLIVHAGTDDIEFTLPGELYGREFRRVLDTADPTTHVGAPLGNGDALSVAARSSVLLQITR